MSVSDMGLLVRLQARSGRLADLYAELKDKNFEIIAVAEDTAGEAAAGEWYDKAKATYTTLIDRDHVVSSLYHMVNVPTGVWIDEQGHVVRPPEVAYSRNVALLSIKVNGSDYVAGLRDWVEHGPQSRYVSTPDELRDESGRPAGAASAGRRAFQDGHVFQGAQRRRTCREALERGPNTESRQLELPPPGLVVHSRGNAQLDGQVSRPGKQAVLRATKAADECSVAPNRARQTQSFATKTAVFSSFACLSDGGKPAYPLIHHPLHAKGQLQLRVVGRTRV